MQILSTWQNFYVIAGTAAATLTGLMFVVITLMARIDSHTSTLNAAVTAFNTPTMVHFCSVLLLAGILSAPWPALASASLVLGLVGLGGTAYMISISRHLRRVPDYQTPLKDWLWYNIFPLSAYIILIGAAAALPASPVPALFLISAVMAALLFLGIHNAWDLVTFLAIDRSHPEQ